jgi:hypothetical protein
MPADEVVTPVGEAEVQPALESSAVAGKPAD